MKLISSKALILFLVVIFLVDSAMPLPCGHKRTHKKGHQLVKKIKHKKPHNTNGVTPAPENAAPLAPTVAADSAPTVAADSAPTVAGDSAKSTTSSPEATSTVEKTSTTPKASTPTPPPPPPPPAPPAPAPPAPAPAAASGGGDHSGQGTFFTPGLGACGEQDNDSSAIVALASPDFDPNTPNGNPNKNSLCGKRIRIFRNGKSADATVTDRCPECHSGDVDMSPSVFNQIASASEGRVQITWKFLS